MKYLATALLFSSLFFVTPVIAGSDHGHGYNSQVQVSSEEVVNRASTIVKKMADAGKIDGSWVGIKAKSVEQKTFSQPEWVIIYENKKISDITKQELYLFYTLSGQYLAANYTGK